MRNASLFPYYTNQSVFSSTTSLKNERLRVNVGTGQGQRERLWPIGVNLNLARTKTLSSRIIDNSFERLQMVADLPQAHL
jgi:hypothetical protein